MRLMMKFACISLLATTSALAAGSYKWTRSKVDYHHSTDESCILRFVDAYQPGGEHQPIHVTVMNDTKKRISYALALSVDGADAGTITVDNVNAGDNSHRDASSRFYGKVEGSTLKIVVTSCKVRKD